MGDIIEPADMTSTHVSSEGALAAFRAGSSSQALKNSAASRHHSGRSSRAWASSVVTRRDGEDGLSPFLTTCVIINYISIGYLFLPWGFAQAGTVLSCFGLLIVSAQSFITAIYVIEACARAERMALWSFTDEGRHYKDCIVFEDRTKRLSTLSAAAFVSNMKLEENDSDDEGLTNKQNDTFAMTNKSQSRYTEGQMDKAIDSTSSTGQTADGVNYDSTTERISQESKRKQRSADEELLQVGTRRFELSELHRIFLGQKAKLFFLATTAFDLYGITWSFAIVSASSLAENIPISGDHEDDYWYYILIYAAVVVPLSCTSVVDQLIIQMIFFVGRMTMVLVMLVTVAVAMVSSSPHFDSQIGANKGVPTSNFPLFFIMMQVAIFSTAYQFCVPCMAEVTKDSKKMVSIFGSACLFILVSTLTVSLLLAIFFGRELIETSSNLNWSAYHGATAFDSMAVFPLCALSLGESLMGGYYGAKVHIVNADWKRRTVFRLLGSVPQIVAAAFLQDIGKLANYAGLFTVISYSIGPALLAVFSQRLLRKVGLSTTTYYRTPFSSEACAWVICLGASMLIVWVIVTSIVVSN